MVFDDNVHLPAFCFADFTEASLQTAQTTCPPEHAHLYYEYIQNI